VDRYAERLRALHRDLTLVLQAVERGLAAAHPEDVGPPVPAHEPIEIVPSPAEDHAPSPAQRAAPRSRMPRVEVMPAPSGESRRHDQEDRRELPPEEPAPRWSKENGTIQDEDDATGGRVPRPAPRFPARPSVVGSDAPPREPEWVDRGDEGFTAPTFPPAGGQRLRVSPLLATAFFVAWLVVVALLIALLVS
jgi:hypothetical protein